MKEELEFKDIACYLPYGLEIEYTNAMDYTDNYTIDGAQVDAMGVVWVYSKKKSLPLIDEFNLKLRPFSQLTEEIEHGGKTFVPIVELMQMCFVDVYLEKNEHEVRIISDDNHGEYYGCKAVDYFPTENDRKDFGFSFDISHFTFTCDGSLLTVNQFKLVEKLNEWHFDWKYDLICRGLAVEKK